MAFNAGFGIRFGIAVAAQVFAPLQHTDVLVEFIGHTFGDRQAEGTGPDYDHVVVFQGTS